MGSVTTNFFKMFRGSGAQNGGAQGQSAARVSRRSSGMGELTRSLAGREGLCILDLGSTSATNISRITGLGHKLYTEDVLLSSYDRSLVIASDDTKTTTIDVARFLSENLAHRGPLFDAVLAWDVPDYLPEPLVKPVVERLCSTMKPGGVLLAFFHTRDAGPDAPHYRYHIAGNDMLELQPTAGNSKGAPMFRLQRVFNNRHIENLFREFASLKFFLARDNVREVLVVR